VRGVGHDFERASNRIHNQSHVVINFMVAKSQHPESFRVQKSRSRRVRFNVCRLEMLWPVQLDNELMRETDEIGDVGANRNLAPKLVPVETLSAQMAP
jgi:hypothetical protein